jgi:hypothetical protein
MYYFTLAFADQSTNMMQPFVSTVGIAWTAYLSLTNSSEEVPQANESRSPNIRLP